MRGAKSINVTPEVYEQLKAFRKGPAESFGKAIARALQSDTPPLDLEAACELVIENLQPHSQQIINEMRQTHGRSAADYILSYCRLVEDQGNVSFCLSEQHLARSQDQQLVPKKPGAKACEFCGTLFTPKRSDYRFCPDPEDGSVPCGRKFFLDQVHKVVPREVQGLEPETETILREITNAPIKQRTGDYPFAKGIDESMGAMKETLADVMGAVPA